MVHRQGARRILRLTAAVAALAVPAAGQPTAPYPVANLNRATPTAEDSTPSTFVPLGERTLFRAETPSQSHELWVTDGTRAGTRFLVDLCPGDCASLPNVLQVVPGLVYFDLDRVVAFERIDNSGLWRSDGTDLGTYRLTPDKVYPVGHAAATGRFLFRPDLGTNAELWSTDGTLEGTVRIEGVEPRGPITSPGAAVGGLVVFSAGTPGSGAELWVSDGTAGGTHLLADLDSSSPSGSRPESFFEAGDFALFVTPSAGDLWATDGTAPGTRRVASGLVAGLSSIAEVVAAGGRAFFTVSIPPRSEVWTTDGTQAGTRLISPAGLDARGIALLGDRVFFAGLLGALGREPWVGDATTGGSDLLADLCPGACGSEPEYLGVAGGRLVFSADDGVHGRELWSTDGTAAGTQLLADLCPGVCDSAFGFRNALAVESRLFVRTERASVVTDGTPAGTVRALAGSGQSASAGFGAVGDLALVPASDALGGTWRLLASDGTLAGTHRLTDFRDLDDSSNPTGLLELRGEALFTADTGAGGESAALFASRGRPGTTRILAPLPAGRHGTRAQRAGDRVFFRVGRFDAGEASLWLSDGTAEGTLDLGEAPPFVVDESWGSLGEDLLAFVHGEGAVRISGPPYHLEPLASVGSPDREFDPLPDESFVPLGGRVLFPTRSSVWATDGTAAGTVDVGHGAPATATIAGWARLGDELFYLSWSEGLWATDGVPGHARQLCPALWMTVPVQVWVRHLFAVGDRLVFSADPARPRSQEPTGLWVSDGESGCELMAPGVTIESSNLMPAVAAVFGGRLFFASDDGVHGTELWVSDGTPEGTALFADLSPGPGESWPHRMEVIGDRLFFSASDGVHGYELWSTDGTVEGTAQVGDVAPGPFSSAPEQLTPVGDTLVFSADDASRGRELWALPLSIPDCADTGTLCLRQDRFRIQVHWRDQRTGNVGAGTAAPFPGSDRTGTFWFFDQDNVELLIKVLPGGAVNGFDWVLYGALSDVEYWLTVTDAETGVTRTYRNPPGTICGRGDTTAFPSAGGAGPGAIFDLGPPAARLPAAASAAPLPATIPWTAPGGSGGCQPDDETLCLLGGRFRVSVEWHDQRSGDSGVGGAIPGTEESGFFWFFDAANVELAVKALDGRVVNDRFWVFYGALSDVEYTIRVVDTLGGGERSFHNPPGEICGGADIEAF